MGDTLLLFKTTHPSIRIMFVQGTAVVADALMMKLHPHCIISNRTKYIFLETQTESPSYPENLFMHICFIFIMFA